MNVLIGCETSGKVREAFRALGHNAWSSDVRPAVDGSPYHLLGDVRRALVSRQWDLFIVHPDCTYLCSSGLHWNTRREGRADKTAAALAFVRELLDADVPRIALENPIGRIGTAIRPADQYVQPYDFGDDASKRTGLWLKGLPCLTPTQRVPGRLVEWPRGSGRIVERWGNQTDSGQNKLAPSANRWQLRAATYPGIAAAMAARWGV